MHTVDLGKAGGGVDGGRGGLPWGVTLRAAFFYCQGLRVPSQLHVSLCRVMAELAMHLINTTFAGVTTRPASDEVRGRGPAAVGSVLVGTCTRSACGLMRPCMPWGHVRLHAVSERLMLVV